MNKFRPQDIPKSYIMKQRLRYGRVDNYNWQVRDKWYPAGWGLNKKVIGSIHGRLHYLASHAPKPIRNKWRGARSNFIQYHFGSDRTASVRYLNKWSCHSWM